MRKTRKITKKVGGTNNIPDILKHDKLYLQELYEKIGMCDIHKAYTDDTQSKTYLFYNYNQIANILLQNIDIIHEKHTIDGFGFRDPMRRKVIIDLLNNYLNYLQKYIDDLGRIPINVIGELTK